MDLREALYTTRAIRRFRPDPIPLEVQARILDAAIRAPNGGNAQAWRFVVVDDPAIKSRVAELYQESFAALMEHGYPKDLLEAQQEAQATNPEPAPAAAVPKPPTPIGEVPLLLFVFNKGDSTGSSSYPAVWSAMLAARGEGVGSVLTAVLSFRRDEIFETIGVPADEGWMMAACITMGYPVAPFSTARRRPVHEVSFRNRWGSPIGFEAPEPLWSPDRPL
jgi:nitroreductase